ncbi:hypothetical protein AVEN_23776-1 [Araneus ventricosus]|uniref:Uncharacterized protein n=1 Tax=Araneus ventricosus TaxID=182803 RepID=A0A4Y2PFX7_ARAVE|nr:hypothetical protein AVEN_23776-1 [Araneus ventricosus]
MYAKLVYVSLNHTAANRMTRFRFQDLSVTHGISSFLSLVPMTCGLAKIVIARGSYLAGLWSVEFEQSAPFLRQIISLRVSGCNRLPLILEIFTYITETMEYHKPMKGKTIVLMTGNSRIPGQKLGGPLDCSLSAYEFSVFKNTLNKQK